MNALRTGGEPYLLPGGPTGCLLLHGFTATPHEMRHLARRLAEEGFSVLAPRLFGHATRPDDLHRARWTDWLASAEDGYHLLRGMSEQVVCIGLSMGGSLAILLSRTADLQALVLLSTPFGLPRARRLWALWPGLTALSAFWRHSRKGPRRWFDAVAAEAHLTYSVRPLRAVAELDRLLAEMRRALPGVRRPALVMHSRDDASVDPGDALRLHAALGSPRRELVWFEGSSHALPEDALRAPVAQAAVDFIRRLPAEPA